jgi:hypothetical protein
MYYIESWYLSEMNRTNPLGMKGAMAEEFGGLIKNLWSGKYNWINANRLRVCFLLKINLFYKFIF